MAYSRHELGTINMLCSLKKLYHTTPLPKAKTVESRSVKTGIAMLFSWNLKTFLGTVFTFMTILMIFGRTGLVSFKQVLDEHAPVKTSTAA